jgi:hypothetical protein
LEVLEYVDVRPGVTGVDLLWFLGAVSSRAAGRHGRVQRRGPMQHPKADIPDASCRNVIALDAHVPGFASVAWTRSVNRRA